MKYTDTDILQIRDSTFAVISLGSRDFVNLSRLVITLEQ